MSQEALAARTRLTREYVSLLESGKRTPTIYVFIRLAKAMGLEPAILISRIEQDKEAKLAWTAPVPKRSKAAQKR